MSKINLNKIILVTILCLGIAAISNLYSQPLCDECKDNPQKCKMELKETAHPQECKHLQNMPPEEAKIIEKKVMIKEGAPKRGFLGIVTVEEDGQLIIDEVLPESPAQKAGLVEGMVILSLNGVKVKNRAELMSVLEKTKPNDEATLVVKTKNKEQTIKVILGEMPKPPAPEMPEMEDMEMEGEAMNKPPMKIVCPHCQKSFILPPKPPKGPNPMCPMMKPEMPMKGKCCIWPEIPGEKRFKIHKKRHKRMMEQGRGAGYFTAGLTMIDFHELNNYLTRHNLDTLSNEQFVFGGGGWGQGNRVRFGGIGMGGGKVVTNDSVSVEIGYGLGLFEVGYALVNLKHLIITPQLGIGGYGVGLKIKALNPPTNLDDLLFYPGGKSQVSKGGLILASSLALDIPINVIGLHLKGGYLYSPLNSAWIHEEFADIQGPDIKIKGPFVSLGIMFGGGE